MPSEEIIIADSSPLIGLARIGQLQCLSKLSQRIVVPRTVWTEVTNAQVDAPGAREVSTQSWIEVQEPDPVLVSPLLIFIGRGEAEAIALALREPQSILLLDDLRARKIAERLGLRRMGTVALLGRAKRMGLIEKLKPCLEALLRNGIYIREELIDAALKEVGE